MKPMKYVKLGRRSKDPSARLIRDAIVVMDKDHYDKMIFTVGALPDVEIQWAGIIERLDHPDAGRYMYRVSDFFIPKQLVSPNTVDTTGAEWMDLWLDVQARRGLTDEEVMELTQKAKWWGHSHIEMSTDPSGTDDDNWKDLVQQAERAGTIAGMIIFNKRYEYFIRIRDTQLNLELVNPTLRVADPTDYTEVEEDIRKRVSKKKPEEKQLNRYGSPPPAPAASPPAVTTPSPSQTAPASGQIVAGSGSASGTGGTSHPTHVSAPGLQVIWDDADPRPLPEVPTRGK